jgi:hypothetical protein
LDNVNTKCKSNFSLHIDNAIDEAMIKFKGRSSLKQYMLMKPIKHGISLGLGTLDIYISEFEVYSGKEDGHSSQDTLGERIVLKLSESLIGGNYHLYYDNFFTSV